MVVIGLLYDHPRWEEKEICRVAEVLGYKVLPLNVERIVLDLNKRAEWINAADIFLQRSVSFYKAYAYSYYVEAFGGIVVNSSSTIWNCGNKFITTLLLSKAGIPTPKAYLVSSRTAALEVAEVIGYPVVVKPVIGGWGRYVVKADTRDSLDGVLELKESLGAIYNLHYVQEFVNKPGRDIRVFVVGDNVPVAIYRVNKSYWKTNTALGAKAEPLKVDEELEKLALKVANVVGGGILGIDIFEDPERGYLVNEVNANVDFRNTVRVTGYNLARDIVEYIVSLVKR